MDKQTSSVDRPSNCLRCIVLLLVFTEHACMGLTIGLSNVMQELTLNKFQALDCAGRCHNTSEMKLPFSDTLDNRDLVFLFCRLILAMNVSSQSNRGGNSNMDICGLCSTAFNSMQLKCSISKLQRRSQYEI